MNGKQIAIIGQSKTSIVISPEQSRDGLFRSWRLVLFQPGGQRFFVGADAPREEKNRQAPVGSRLSARHARHDFIRSQSTVRLEGAAQSRAVKAAVFFLVVIGQCAM